MEYCRANSPLVLASIYPISADDVHLLDYYTKVSARSFAKAGTKQNSGTAAALNPFAGMAALC